MKKISCLVLALMFVFLTSCKESEAGKTESSVSDVSEDTSSGLSPDNSSDSSENGSQDVSQEPNVFQSINLMEYVTPNKITPTDLTAGNKAYMDFATKLFKESLSKDGENTLISPLSVIYAMGMTTNGASGKTKAQLEEVFGINSKGLNEYLYSYAVETAQKKGAKLSIANSIWYDKNRINVFPQFLQTNADYYGAGAYLSDFSNTETVKDINNWCSERTDEMIKEIITEIDKDTIMYLINALAFEAEWVEPYEKNSVRKGDFTSENGETVETDFMYASDGYYIEDENTTGFIKQYKGGYAFVALLPSEEISIENYVSSLTGEKISKLLESRNDFSSYVPYSSLPKFETEYSISMKAAFKSLGATDAFNGTADFSEMGVANGNIYISDILHKTFISVAEKGTKAGAVTAVIVGAESCPEYKYVHLNRPFVYMLIDTTTYTPFFIGTMMNPA